jgi:hypothetical protein
MPKNLDTVIFFMIIAVVALVRVLKYALEQQESQQRRGPEESSEWLDDSEAGDRSGWEDWQALGEMIETRRREVMTPQTEVPPVPAVPLGPQEPKPAAPAAAPVRERVYLDQKEISQIATRSREVTAAKTAGMRVSELAEQSLALAFPDMPTGPRRSRSGRAPIRLRLRGRADLSRAVLYGEIISLPRAFDV